MENNGSISLDPAFTQYPKTIRVRISVDGKITGTSSLDPVKMETSPPIEKVIQLARDSIFEEEIYHEISVERRQLSSYGVELQDSVIHVPAPNPTGKNKRTVLIDCVNRDEKARQSEDHTEDFFARTVAECLRVLLSHEHRMRLYRRSQPPPPLSQAQLKPPAIPLLRAMLCLFCHIEAVDALRDYLRRTTTTLASAGIEVAADLSYETSWLDFHKLIIDSSIRGLSAMDKLLDSFTKSFASIAYISLPSSIDFREEITVETRTSLSKPLYGAEYTVMIPKCVADVLHFRQEQKREFKFNQPSELISYLDWIFSIDLAHTSISKDYPMFSAVDHEPMRSMLLKQRGKQLRKDLIIELSKGILKVVVQTADGVDRDDFIWDGTPGKEPFSRKLQSLAKGITETN